MPIVTEVRNLLIQQSQPFELIVSVKDSVVNLPISLTPYIFRSQVRRTSDLTSDLISNVSCQIQTDTTKLKLSIPTTNSIPPNVINSEIPEDYELLASTEISRKAYYWSLRAFDSQDNPLFRAFEGRVLVTPEVTSSNSPLDPSFPEPDTREVHTYSFTHTNLVGSDLFINHGLGRIDLDLFLIDPSNNRIRVDFTDTSSNTLRADLTGLVINSTWTAVVIG